MVLLPTLGVPSNTAITSYTHRMVDTGSWLARVGPRSSGGAVASAVPTHAVTTGVDMICGPMCMIGMSYPDTATTMAALCEHTPAHDGLAAKIPAA